MRMEQRNKEKQHGNGPHEVKGQGGPRGKAKGQGGPKGKRKCGEYNTWKRYEKIAHGNSITKGPKQTAWQRAKGSKELGRAESKEKERKRSVT